jgi:hypothetical protein
VITHFSFHFSSFSISSFSLLYFFYILYPANLPQQLKNGDEEDDDDDDEENNGTGNDTIGNYVRARQLLKRAALEHEKGFADKEEAQIEARAAERQMDEMIRLSTNTGAPTLKNRTTRQMELKLRELTQRRDGAPPDKPATEVDVSVFRSYVAGEFVSVGEHMKALPPEVFSTFFSFFLS